MRSEVRACFAICSGFREPTPTAAALPLYTDAPGDGHQRAARKPGSCVVALLDANRARHIRTVKTIRCLLSENQLPAQAASVSLFHIPTSGGRLHAPSKDNGTD